MFSIQIDHLINKSLTCKAKMFRFLHQVVVRPFMIALSVQSWGKCSN